ncbi:MAG: lipocalin-like domain-containing protein [Thermomicrobia bacterium]|nr:lipocalin-like domain-containing protein [Thermomicrobia bacterium]MCA1723769.1 lipocalin-like domain-containing protein [Thermomicrobia bacterium]
MTIEEVQIFRLSGGRIAEVWVLGDIFGLLHQLGATIHGEKERSSGNPLIGTWRLVTCEVCAADGTVSYPFGRDAIASIVYTADGYMSYQIMAEDRQPFIGGDLLGATIEEQLVAARTFQSYCGTYAFRGGTVVHHREVSSFPDWIGTDRVRSVMLVGDQFTLSAGPLTLQGKLQVARLLWRRAGRNLDRH